MNARKPMPLTQTLRDYWKSIDGTDVARRAASLEEMFEAFKDIPSSVLDRIARVVLREQPGCDTVLRKFAASAHHRDDGIGDLMAVAFSTVVDDRVREELCALYLDTVALAMESRSQGRFDYDGLSNLASRNATGDAVSAAA